MREEEEKAKKEVDKEQPGERQEEKPAKELEVDFDVKETGQKKQIAGYDTHEVIMTVTVREKGKTLEDGGGLVMNVDSWVGPHIHRTTPSASSAAARSIRGPIAAQ